MAGWLFTTTNVLAVLGAIILTHWLFLLLQLYRDSKGYMWRCARKIRAFLLKFITIEWAIGSLLFFLTRGLTSYIPVPAPLWACIIGIIVATASTALESFLLPKDNTTLKTLQRLPTRLILKWNIVLRYKLAWAIEYCRQQDVYDCQEPNAWGLNLSRKVVGRRIRMLYEIKKYDIAKERGDPSLMAYDAGCVPPDQFYLLVRHVGRKKLREYIKNPIIFPNWDGGERRRRARGTKADRDTSIGNASQESRKSDDPDLVRKIESRGARRRSARR
jgi:hypothetical protein